MNANNKMMMYLAAGVGGFILGVLYAPAEGKVSRLKFKRGVNKLAGRAISEIENLEKGIGEVS